MRPGQRETMLLWGDVQGLRGNIAEARVTWLNALKIPESKTSQIRAMSRDYSTSAGRKLVTGDLVKAELWYRRAVVLDEQNLAALMGLANTFMRKDKPRHALAFAYKVLAISDLVPEMQVLVGSVAAQAGDQAEARSRYEKALTIRSDFFPAKRGLSELQ
jgi:predicted negative regulator of RcsB-dependent stress response